MPKTIRKLNLTNTKCNKISVNRNLEESYSDNHELLTHSYFLIDEIFFTTFIQYFVVVSLNFISPIYFNLLFLILYLLCLLFYIYNYGNSYKFYCILAKTTNIIENISCVFYLFMNNVGIINFFKLIYIIVSKIKNKNSVLFYEVYFLIQFIFILINLWHIVYKIFAPTIFRSNSCQFERKQKYQSAIKRLLMLFILIWARNLCNFFKYNSSFYLLIFIGLYLVIGYLLPSIFINRSLCKNQTRIENMRRGCEKIISLVVFCCLFETEYFLMLNNTDGIFSFFFF
ncbi:hypothetical protein TUBRATIS_23920 [Tubulinosema ratisbonensis]|uniref:Uncharacterized protein n=1 Tax=Tubulinosema ratisbonensis TaxID=291195 RepID=A0A437AJ39_9MICR|nr:hypothetical protein TUBRATIS_23920 [Tubulinosema ratisbonensis]